MSINLHKMVSVPYTSKSGKFNWYSHLEKKICKAGGLVARLWQISSKTNAVAVINNKEINVNVRVCTLMK